ncbi:hypothetical protein JCM5296_005808 [Sporobolomyces johnsonii]
MRSGPVPCLALQAQQSVVFASAPSSGGGLSQPARPVANSLARPSRRRYAPVNAAAADESSDFSGSSSEGEDYAMEKPPVGSRRSLTRSARSDGGESGYRSEASLGRTRTRSRTRV